MGRTTFNFYTQFTVPEYSESDSDQVKNRQTERELKEISLIYEWRNTKHKIDVLFFKLKVSPIVDVRVKIWQISNQL